MNPSNFSPDILDFIGLMHAHDVRYLIVGGEAVIYYGYARLTGDVDFFYEASEENTCKLFSALQEFWSGAIPGIASHKEFLKEGAVIQFGRPPNRIDFVNKISGLTFAKAWNGRVIEELKTSAKSVYVYYIGLKDLITNKRKAARYKDLEDLKYLVAVEDKE